MPTPTNGESKPKQVRGFALLSPKLRAKVCAMGGKSTAKRHGKAHMARIGRRGRAKRSRLERAAQKAATMHAMI